MSIWHRKLTEHIDRRVSNPAIVALLQRWQGARAAGLPDALAFGLHALDGDLAGLAPNLMLLEPEGDDWSYRHYGSDIARQAGFDMTGRRVSSFGGELAEFFLDCYRDCLARGEPLYTVHYADRARSVFTWERLLLPLAGADGRPWLLVYNRPLQSRLDLQQQVLNASGDAILALQALRDDAGRCHDWLVLMLNDAMAELVGVARSAAAGQPASEVLLRWPDLGLDGVCAGVVDDPERPRVEREIELTVAGKGRTLLARIQRLEPAAAGAGDDFGDACLLRLSDLGEWRRREQALRQSRQQANDARETGLRWLGLIEADLSQALEAGPAQAQTLAALLVALQGLQQELSAGSHPPQPSPAAASPLPLRDWLRGLRDAALPRVHAAGARLLVEIPPQSATAITGTLADPLAWQSLAGDVLWHVLAAAAPGSAPRIHLRLTTDSQRAQLQLRLEPTEATPEADPDPARVTGGAAAAGHVQAEWLRLRAERLGGTLRTASSSTPTVDLWLPLGAPLTPDTASPTASSMHAPAAAAALRVEAGGQRQAGPRVLVVEDDAVNRLVLRRQLELLGCSVELAEQGRPALDLWQDIADAGVAPILLVLSDLHMPTMDGFAFARALRRREKAQQRPRVPMLAISGNAEASEARLALQAGMDGMLAKPVQLGELRLALARWLTEPAGDHEAHPAARVLDLGVLRRLLGHDEAAVRELLADYRLSADRLAGEMSQAFRHGDASQLAAIAHKLKSASHAVGAAALAELCAQLERRQWSSDPESVAASLQVFDRAMAAVSSRIDEYMTSHPGDLP